MPHFDACPIDSRLPEFGKSAILGMMPKPPHDKLPKNVHREQSRHGKLCFYFRLPGEPRIRLYEIPGTPEFEREVARARVGDVKEQTAKPVRSKLLKSGSLDELLASYKKRAVNSISEGTWARRIRMIEEVCDSLAKGKTRRGDLPYAMMRRRHVMEIRDELRERQGARNNVVKALSAMFAWAVKAELMDVNPGHEIERPGGNGFHAWSVDEVRQYEARHPTGTRARLALDIALYTGLRRQEVAIFGRQHVKDGWIKITPGKTRKSSGVVVEIPMLAELAASIAATPGGDLTFLVSEYGHAYTVDGLGNRFRDWCDRADLPHCTMHGLRKAGATIAAENGATDEELMAIFGWVTKQQTTGYTKTANRKKLARGAIHKLIPAPEKPVGEGAGENSKLANEING